ncbi:hypothetical protein V495_06089 [Pseudogymnoascus sp. VKM F-4514 (FW-929)]|nr:hypothetical protein V495_06089 [Pseudogymnoascus sp. VKM F-4514 (FW-929)]KFY53788.1 hypothetical protein V497_08240 [Pseudogymnoascus sp. VKM F-4516 (FW-969)]
MTAVANPPSFQQPLNRTQWSSNGQGALNSMNPDEVARMFMPRKSVQRANSSSSLSSNSSASSSGSSTMSNASQQSTGTVTPMSDVGTWSSTGTRKKPQRTGPWPVSKSEPVSGVTSARPQSILAPNGASAASSISSMQQQHSVLPSNLQNPSQQQNGARAGAPLNDGNPVLYLLSMNGTFERKTITVPYYPDNLRIGRQTNAKSSPTATNGFFDSKVLSRQHAEIWADRNGKVWIRDIRSSNGTFVNGARLSPENRDSEPHELQTQDHLELGIDIVSEDQKTVVHHKVAAKVEHAGFLGATNNVLDMNFGDLDPANGVLMLPSQNGMVRGRTNSQGSILNNGRAPGPGIMNAAQRPTNFWLTPVTTEQIMKRLTNEMRDAKLQNNDLSRTELFLDTLVSQQLFKEEEKPEEPIKSLQPNGVSFKIDAKPRFSDPPAPPPQQPLPEKPDAPRVQTSETSLRRSNTERPRSATSASPVKENSSQIIALIESLESAKREIDQQSERMRDLERMLQEEREARQAAEELAKRFEEESKIHMNGFAKGGAIVEDAFEPPQEVAPEVVGLASTIAGEAKANASSAEQVEASTNTLQEKLDLMMVEMREMKLQMETYRQRADTAETERDDGRKSLAEMVEKIRADDQARRETAERAKEALATANIAALSTAGEDKEVDDVQPAAKDIGQNGTLSTPHTTKPPENQHAITLQHYPGGQDHRLLEQSAPYASMIGVVLLGMGLMAYMNGWQKPGER